MLLIFTGVWNIFTLIQLEWSPPPLTERNIMRLLLIKIQNKGWGDGRTAYVRSCSIPHMCERENQTNINEVDMENMYSMVSIVKILSLHIRAYLIVYVGYILFIGNHIALNQNILWLCQIADARWTGASRWTFQEGNVQWVRRGVFCKPGIVFAMDICILIKA